MVRRHDFAKPDGNVEHGIWRNQPGHATTTIRKMRTDTNFAKTTHTHTHDSLLNTGYYLMLTPASKYGQLAQSLPDPQGSQVQTGVSYWLLTIEYLD